MPSRGNPNVPNNQKRKASRSKVQRRNANKVVKNPRSTAASAVLHPTSGPAAPLSGKKARKVEKAIKNARRRALEAAMEKEGEVSMIDAPKLTKRQETKHEKYEDKMEIDDIQ